MHTILLNCEQNRWEKPIKDKGKEKEENEENGHFIMLNVNNNSSGWFDVYFEFGHRNDHQSNDGERNIEKGYQSKWFEWW